MPRLSPKVLKWARETADLPIEEAARKIGLRDSGKGTAVERLEAIEAGWEEPTPSLVSRMAKKYRQPLVTLYLPEPPRRSDRGEDFRTLPADYRAEGEALVDALLRDIRVRQRLIRGALEITRADIRAAATPEAAFQMARERAEKVGTFVLLIGDLGSHHTQIDVDVFRGFSLADPVAPFVVVNDQDARTAWTFTLLHEFVHLLVGVTGVSAGTPVGEVEQFCNAVASRFLVSERELLDLAGTLPTGVGDIAEMLTRRSRQWNVSRSLLAYRLLRAGKIEKRLWSRLSSQFEQEWREYRERQRTAASRGAGGPSYYVVRRHRLGPRLIDVTSRMLYAGALTTTRAGQVLGVSPKKVGRFTTLSPECPSSGPGWSTRERGGTSRYLPRRWGAPRPQPSITTSVVMSMQPWSVR